MPSPLVPLDGLNELASGGKQPAQRTDGQVAAQTIVDCSILATPGETLSHFVPLLLLTFHTSSIQVWWDALQSPTRSRRANL
jgi:hypothetical protein